jgi:Domain of unknown function (DUF4082)/Secretion system C-terminal sorting domain
MTQTQPSRSTGVKYACLLLLISFFVFSHSFAQITTIFTTQTPVAAIDNDHKPTVGQELGVKFKSSATGYIIGVRFFKQYHDNGTHIGELYSAAGVRLAQATFINETDGGWQVVQFATPVAVTANTTYTAAYFSSQGNYTEDNNYFLNHPVTNGPLTAPADGTNGASGTDPGSGQGVFKYSASPAFPNQLYKSANYWVDAIYSATAPTPAVANAGMNRTVNLGQDNSVTLDGSGSTGTIFSYLWTLVSGPSIGIFSTPDDQPICTAVELFPGTYIFELLVNGGASKSRVSIKVNPTQAVANAGEDQTITLPVSTVILDGNSSSPGYSQILWSEISGPNTAIITTPTELSPVVTNLIAGTYIFQLSLTDAPSPSQVTVTVLPGPTVPGNNIFTTQIPVSATDNDHQTSIGFEAGVKFRSSVAGTITGVRFYKTSGNEGTHIGELYSSSGSRLAQATFSGETATGWQTVSFASPVVITSNTTYVAAYFSSFGNYVEDNGFFSSAVANGPLTALADGTDGGNAPFRYTGTPAFPNQNYKKANYWVDVVFSPGSNTPSAVANAGINQTITLPVNSVTLDGTGSTGTITSYSWKLLSSVHTNQIPVITSPNAVTTSVTGLSEGTYTFGLSVNNIAPASVVVIIVNGPPNGSTIFTTQIPTAKTDNDHRPTVGHEVGVRFTTSSFGYINGIRFYKTAGNTGTHIGELYYTNGFRLAQATFVNETATGWQYVQFSSPVQVFPNDVLVAAYFSSLGNYTEENNYFLNHSVTNIPLTAPADGTNGASGLDPGTGQGVYLYTSAPAFPNQLYKSANYWVDVNFTGTLTQNAEPAKALEAKAVDTNNSLPENLSWFLGQNYPNPVPMSQNTKIGYSVPISSKVELVLYDMQGRPVKIMVNEMKNAGRYSYDLNTGVLSKGLYIYSIHAGDFHDVKKLVVQ